MQQQLAQAEGRPLFDEVVGAELADLADHLGIGCGRDNDHFVVEIQVVAQVFQDLQTRQAASCQKGVQQYHVRREYP